MERNFYSMRDYFLKIFDENYRQFGFFGKSDKELLNWQKDTKTKLLKLLGIDKMKKCDMQPKVVESVQFEDYRRDKVVIETQKDVFLPMFVLIPKKSKNIPVIAIHGHASDGKNGLVGIVNDLTRDKIESYNYTYGLDLVKRGYTVFCPDLCGSGERREVRQRKESCVLESSCNDINNAAISLGLSLLGIMVFDLIRVIDYIAELGFDEENVACCGFSGGGLCGLWLSALDDRVKCSVVSGYFHGLRDTILDNNLCGCNFVYDMWRYIDICDLGSLVAPRRLLIESGKSDKLNGVRGLENVFEQIVETKKSFNLLRSGNLVHKIFDGGHKWYGSAYEFLDDWSWSF